MTDCTRSSKHEWIGTSVTDDTCQVCGKPWQDEVHRYRSSDARVRDLERFDAQATRMEKLIEQRSSKQLPSWEDCRLAVDAGRATPLQAFIYEYEPSLTPEVKALVDKCIPSSARRTDSQFRQMLAAAVAADEPPATTPTKLHEVWCGWRQTSRCNCGAHPPVAAEPPTDHLVPLLSSAAAFLIESRVPAYVQLGKQIRATVPGLAETKSAPNLDGAIVQVEGVRGIPDGLYKLADETSFVELPSAPERSERNETRGSSNRVNTRDSFGSDAGRYRPDDPAERRSGCGDDKAERSSSDEAGETSPENLGAGLGKPASRMACLMAPVCDSKNHWLCNNRRTELGPCSCACHL